MRINRIFIRNINGLRGEHDFDLSKFSGLFAITGPTGAGKTTLLDALCLALYGRTPRLKSLGPSQNELLTLGEDFCQAVVEFSLDGRRYVAHWQQKRARGKQPFGAPSHRLSTGAGEILSEKKSETEAAIAALLGLNFEQFCQTVLLAQGQFARFLHASENERAQLFESIAPAGLYRRLSALSYARAKAETTALEARRTALGQGELLSAAERAALEQEWATLEASPGPARLATLRQQLWQWAEGDRLAGEESQLAAAERALAQRQGQWSPERFARAEAAAAGAEIYGRWTGQNQRRAQLEAQRATLENEWNAGARERAARAETLAVAERALQDSQEALRAAEARQQQRATAARERDFLHQQLRSLPPAAPGTEDDNDAPLPPAEREALARAAEDAGHWLRAEQAAAAVARARREQAEREAQCHRLDGELATAEAEQSRASWNQQRAELHPGEPCPLCGSTEHPWAGQTLAAPPLARLRQRWAEARRALATATATLQQLEGEAARLPRPGGQWNRASAEEVQGQWQREQQRQRRQLVQRLEQLDQLLRTPDPLPQQRHARDEAQRRYQDAQREWQAAEARQQQRQGRRQQLEAQRAELDGLLPTLAAEWADYLAASPFTDEADFNAARLGAGDWARLQAERQELLRLAAENRSWRTRWQAAKLAFDGLQLPPRERLAAELATAEEADRQEQQRRAEIAQLLRRQEEQERRQAEEQAALLRQQAEADGWQRLSALIGSAQGDALVRFVQGISFDRLLQRANGQLRLIAPRYQLERLPHGLQLQVCDWAQGGARRSCQNLSGGESFLVSLALALGLAELGGGRLDCLFLDEGFGTLDSDSLDMALEALLRLQDRGKMVGVISHMETLKERISDGIRLG